MEEVVDEDAATLAPSHWLSFSARDIGADPLQPPLTRCFHVVARESLLVGISIRWLSTLISFIHARECGWLR